VFDFSLLVVDDILYIVDISNYRFSLALSTATKLLTEISCLKCLSSAAGYKTQGLRASPPWTAAAQPEETSPSSSSPPRRLRRSRPAEHRAKSHGSAQSPEHPQGSPPECGRTRPRARPLPKRFAAGCRRRSPLSGSRGETPCSCPRPRAALQSGHAA